MKRTGKDALRSRCHRRSLRDLGRGISCALLWLLLLPSMQTQAMLTVSADRSEIAMGETLMITFSADAGEDLDALELGPLQDHFDLLQRSSSSSTRIVNGNRSETHSLQLQVSPKREGDVDLPPLRAGTARSNGLTITVLPASTLETGGQPVVFEAEVSGDSVYVQGQLILTLRIMQAINLEEHSVSELHLDNAFVKPLQQHSFQRQINGKPWLVHEISYAIFPEQSGTLRIPAQTFSAREALPRRSVFDRGGNGPLLRRSSETLDIDVLPRPREFPSSATWLPASKLSIEESWSVPPDQLRQGESATRTLRIVGEGLQGAQLPPTLFPAQQGLKYYPDQPQVEDQEVSSGLQGVRVDSAALVPTDAGSWIVPEIRLPWWDTKNNVLRYAVVPERSITVAANANANAASTPLPAARDVDIGQAPPITEIPILAAAAAADDTAPPWPWMAATFIASLAWLLTVLYYQRIVGRNNTAAAKDNNRVSSNEKRAFKTLLASCEQNDASAAAQALLHWGRLRYGEQVISVAELQAKLAQADLDEALRELNSALYSADCDTAWQGAALAAALQGVQRRDKRKEAAEKSAQAAQSLPPLYPSGGN